MHPSVLAHGLRLVVITDIDLARPRDVVDVVRAAVQAGAPAVQLRDKAAGASELFDAGQVMLPIVHAAGALFFVNDRVDVALALAADGVHVGPDDLPVSSVRGATPRGFVIGTSADHPEVAQRLVKDGVDYVGCGAVYATTTKSDAGAAIGLAGLTQVVEAVDVPVVGIGGITVQKASEVATTGAAGVAVVGAVMRAPEIADAVRTLLAPWANRT